MIFQIKLNFYEKRYQELEYPSLDEYNFHPYTILKNLNIELRPNAILRSYQEKSLKNIFGNGHARSRLIVLPCGARKSLVGVTAAFVNSNVQLFTSSDEHKLNDSCICISAYRIIAPIEQSNDKISRRSWEWSLMLPDEVHTKLCLTAKLVRENDKIADLNCLIGSKL
ncbi:unnamed protein product [Rotaria sp. Silwood2]|nr:unnamed protein product [Rotaria sp. Silwood2]